MKKPAFCRKFFKPIRAYPDGYGEGARPMLRHITEKFPLKLRKKFLFGKITTENKKQEG